MPITLFVGNVEDGVAVLGNDFKEVQERIEEAVDFERRNRFYFPMSGAIFYLLGIWMPVPFAPMGAFLTGLGMIIVGLASIKAKFGLAGNGTYL